MRTNVLGFEVKATKIYMPELDKGERNPYTSGDEIGNPYMKDKFVKIKEEDVNDLLAFLEAKGYDVSEMK